LLVIPGKDMDFRNVQAKLALSKRLRNAMRRFVTAANNV
jgi:hypothetical protein